MSETGQPKKPAQIEFKINRSVPRSLMYFQNTSTNADPNRMVIRNVPRSEVALPIPPPHLMEYQESEQVYLNSGFRLSMKIRKTLAGNGIEIGEFKRALEFGCSNSRVLRHFEDLAKLNSYYGCDINANTILWNIENLSPPFQYFVSTTLPSLPVRDGFFDFVYACSVFTHMDDMFFTWLMEMKRIVKPGGHLFLTFLNEPSIQFGLDNPNYPVGKQIAANRELIDDLLAGKYNMVVIHRDSYSMTYIRHEYLKQRLSMMFDITAVVEETMAGHQTGFLLRNR